MRYASDDFMDNMFGGYSPAKHMVKNRRRTDAEMMEMEAREAEKCGCKDMKGVGHG